MARVTGIGGIFFKCRDKAALTAWYEQALGMTLSELGGIEFQLQDAPAGAYCVWGPFPTDTDYFAPSSKDFMINLMVDDLEQALHQVEQAGGKIVGGIESHDYGRFGWFVDPEGNKIELWQPVGR